jgi:hypothetical protein
MANVVLALVNDASRILPVLVVNNRMSLLQKELVIKLVKSSVCVIIFIDIVDIIRCLLHC